MENCLKTQLKGSVNNSNLPVFDAFVLKVNNTTQENKVFTVNGSVGDVITIEASESKIQFNQQSAPANKLSFTCTSSNKLVYCYPGEYTVRIKSKYKVKALNLTQYIAIDIDQIGKTNIETFSANYAVSSYTGINTNGDITSLGALTSITSINLIYTAVTGSVEDFVKEQVKNGRSTVGTSEPISFGKTTTTIPLGSKNTDNSTNWYLSWESASKMFIFNNATFASATNIYCYGYSDTEIATKTASGGDWESKTVTKCD